MSFTTRRRTNLPNAGAVDAIAMLPTDRRCAKISSYSTKVAVAILTAMGPEDVGRYGLTLDEDSIKMFFHLAPAAFCVSLLSKRTEMERKALLNAAKGINLSSEVLYDLFFAAATHSGLEEPATPSRTLLPPPHIESSSVDGRSILGPKANGEHSPLTDKAVI